MTDAWGFEPYIPLRMLNSWCNADWYYQWKIRFVYLNMPLLNWQVFFLQYLQTNAKWFSFALLPTFSITSNYDKVNEIKPTRKRSLKMVISNEMTQYVFYGKFSVYNHNIWYIIHIYIFMDIDKWIFIILTPWFCSLSLTKYM